MRRETDFVLEHAAWPALLLEATGTIRRANPAARQAFGDAIRGKSATLAALWAEKAGPDAAETFLTGNGKEAPRQLKLRLSGGAIGTFVAQVSPVSREGQNYFLLQLFNASEGHFPELIGSPLPQPAAPAPKPVPPEESEVTFALENAQWPALLVEKSGRILRANRGAVHAFGSSIQKPDSALAGIWFQDNQESVQQLLRLPPRDEATRIKFRLNSGVAAVFMTQCCPTARGQEFLLQLFKEVSPANPVSTARVAPTTTPAAAVPAAAANSGPAAGTEAQVVESSLSQKQKLDCAMQLARTVALDFNNALTSILGHTSLLLSSAEPNHPWRRSLLEVEKSAAKAAEIANDLGAFSYQDKEARGQNTGNLNLLLQRCVESFQRTCPPEKVAWSLPLERRLFAAKFDEAKMQQAFIKIIENAIEALQAKGSITIRSRNLQLTEPTQDLDVKLAAGAYVCTEISDTGRGIEPDVLPRIFEPFFTTKRGNHRGLGLALVYGIVTNHGGGVAVSSKPGSGTTVRVYLPSTTKIAKGNTPASPSVNTNLTGKETILLVDDEELVLTMGQTVLATYGYQVITANSGQKALDILSKGNAAIELLITDLVMPGMSGRELVEYVRRLSPAIRIICSSGNVWPTNKEEDVNFLRKPFTIEELLQTVKHALTAPDNTSDNIS